MKDEIKAGDVVQFKSGGAKMTARRDEKYGLVDLMWFDFGDHGPRGATDVPVIALQKVQS